VDGERKGLNHVFAIAPGPADGDRVTTNREVFDALPKAFLALLPAGGIEAMSHSMKPVGVRPCFKQPLNRGTGFAIAPFEGKAFKHLPVILQHADHVGVAPLQVAKDWPCKTI
jgi:hypothetical protein